MSASSLTDRHAAAQQVLDPVGQRHVLGFYDQLNDAQKNQLLAQIEAIDWQEIGRLIADRAPVLKFAGEAFVDDVLVCSTTFTCVGQQAAP